MTLRKSSNASLRSCIRRRSRALMLKRAIFSVRFFFLEFLVAFKGLVVLSFSVESSLMGGP